MFFFERIFPKNVYNDFNIIDFIFTKKKNTKYFVPLTVVTDGLYIYTVQGEK